MEYTVRPHKLIICLIGKTGCGKSSTGNTILGSEQFSPARGWAGCTQKGDWNYATVDGTLVEVIDTPGVCDTKRSDAEIHKEITKALVLMAPGPHVLLLVVKGADRFTKEEMDAYEQLKDMFGPSFTNYIIVVFTGIDQLQSEGTTLEKQFANAPDRLKTVLREAGNRYFGINNKASQTERQDQGRLLIQMIMQLVQTNNNKYYSNDLFKRFDDSITTIQSKNVNLNIQQIKERIAKNQIDSKRFESLLDLSNEKARILCILL